MASEKTVQKQDASSPWTNTAGSTETGSNNSDQRRERSLRDPFSMNSVIGWILQGGVMLSSAVICAGIVLWIVRIGQHQSQQLLVFPHTPGEVWSGLLALHPQAVIALGLLLLLATPVVRVFASIFAFALENDRRYVAITTLVLAILLVSFLLGKGAG